MGTALSAVADPQWEALLYQDAGEALASQVRAAWACICSGSPLERLGCK